MDLESAFSALGVALGVGLLIGFEREQSARADEVAAGPQIGGVRTYPLVALAGALAALVAREVGPWFVALAFGAMGGLVAISYADDVRNGRDRGLTSEASLLVTFLLGALAPSERIVPDQGQKVLVLFSVAVVVSLILSAKPVLHAIAQGATKNDVYATLKFLIVAIVVLPLLPDLALGPYGAFNPFKVGVVVALIAGVGFMGYVAVRVLGPGRGLGLTGLLGGLVSSTAVTMAAAGRARAEPPLAASCALAVLLAGTVMLGRVVVIACALNSGLAGVLAAPIGAMAVVGLGASYVLWRQARSTAGEADRLAVTNPFELASAVKLGLMVVVVLVVSKAATEAYGAGGLYAASVLAGTTDVDAITASAANLTRGSDGLPLASAATAIVLAVLTNTVAKTIMAAVAGGGDFARRVVLASLATLAAGAGGLLWNWFFAAS